MFFLFLFFFVRSIAWTQLPHACFCFIPIDRCSCQSTKTFYLKAKGTWWKKVWSKRALCSLGCQLRYLTTVTLYKIFPLFSLTNMYIPRHNFAIFFAYQRHFINRAWFIFVVSLTIVLEWQSAFCLYAKSFIKLLWDPLFYYKRHKVTVITPPLFNFQNASFALRKVRTFFSEQERNSRCPLDCKCMFWTNSRVNRFQTWPPTSIVLSYCTW